MAIATATSASRPRDHILSRPVAQRTQDMVPKIVIALLVNRAKEEIQPELVRRLYADAGALNSVDGLLRGACPACRRANRRHAPPQHTHCNFNHAPRCRRVGGDRVPPRGAERAHRRPAPRHGAAERGARERAERRRQCVPKRRRRLPSELRAIVRRAHIAVRRGGEWSGVAAAPAVAARLHRRQRCQRHVGPRRRQRRV